MPLLLWGLCCPLPQLLCTLHPARASSLPSQGHLVILCSRRLSSGHRTVSAPSSQAVLPLQPQQSRHSRSIHSRDLRAPLPLLLPTAWNRTWAARLAEVRGCCCGVAATACLSWAPFSTHLLAAPQAQAAEEWKREQSAGVQWQPHQGGRSAPPAGWAAQVLFQAAGGRRGRGVHRSLEQILLPC